MSTSPLVTCCLCFLAAVLSTSQRRAKLTCGHMSWGLPGFLQMCLEMPGCSWFSTRNCTAKAL